MPKSVLLALYYLIEFIQAQKYEKKPYFELLCPSPIDVNHGAVSRRAPNKGAKSSPKGICQPHRNVTLNTSLSVTSARRGTVYRTQPFGKLKQTLSKKQQENVFANLTSESVIEEADP